MDNTIENKKWLLNQIGQVLDAYQAQLYSNKENFERLSRERVTRINNLRNAILLLASLVATIALSLTSIQPLRVIMNDWLIPLLIIDAGIALVVYIGSLFVKTRISQRISQSEKEYYDGYVAQSFLKGFLYRISIYAERFNINQFISLHYYYTVIQGGITSKIVSLSSDIFICHCTLLFVGTTSR